jgi:hypothetical protein
MLLDVSAIHTHFLIKLATLMIFLLIPMGPVAAIPIRATMSLYGQVLGLAEKEGDATSSLCMKTHTMMAKNTSWMEARELYFEPRDERHITLMTDHFIKMPKEMSRLQDHF